VLKKKQVSQQTLLSFATVMTWLVMVTTSSMAYADLIPIELTPTDVGSLSSDTFSTLPTANPALFGIVGADVRSINFDVDPFGNPIPSGTSLTNQYESIGVILNGIVVSSGVFGGAASPPNATITPFTPGLDLIFTFTVPVVSFGAINTSPDADVLEFWSGPNATGTLLASFADQGGTNSPNFNVDRFIGGIVTGTSAIQSVVYENNTGQIELDEFIFSADENFFEPGGQGNPNPTEVPEPSTFALLALGLALLGFCGSHSRRRPGRDRRPMTASSARRRVLLLPR